MKLNLNCSSLASLISQKTSLLLMKVIAVMTITTILIQIYWLYSFSPRISDYPIPEHEPLPPFRGFNASKVALLVDNRPSSLLAPLMLHFMAVVPPDWRFHFMGSPESLAAVNASAAIRHQVAVGKLNMTLIPGGQVITSQEHISRFLTQKWLYTDVLHPAEWVLVFQSDSILCSKSTTSVDDFLEYDWVGAPWTNDARPGANGGLSLRKIAPIIDVLETYQREWFGDPEDVWLTQRLAWRPDSRTANRTIKMTFSAESQIPESDEEKTDLARAGALRGDLYEPMGYHLGFSGETRLQEAVFGKEEDRKHIWEYCPEIKMLFEMDVEKYVPGSCYYPGPPPPGKREEMLRDFEKRLVPW